MAAAAAAARGGGRGQLVTSPAEAVGIARQAKRVAVLGIKPESRADQPAHYVPKYLSEAGVEVVPVPTFYPQVTEILGTPVVRELAAVGAVDIVDVFRRAEDCDAHVLDLLAMSPPPRVVWLQSGIVASEAFLERVLSAGVDVVQDRCLMVDHKAAATASNL